MYYFRLAQFAGVALIVLFVSGSRTNSQQTASQAAASKSAAPVPSETPGSIPHPSPLLSPEEVARIQMQALSAAGPTEKRIERCYLFASPANRAHTGPIQRFAAMVQSPEYQALLNAKHFLVGRATQQQDEAHLLVTTVDSAGQLTLFRFFLSKQNEAPYSNCWMTDAVIRVGVANPPGDSKKTPAESPAI